MTDKAARGVPEPVLRLVARGFGSAAATGEISAVARAGTVVLVEGVSDRLALLTLAELRGRDLDAEGVAVLPMGGAGNVRAYVEAFGPEGLDRTLAGLCDAGEEDVFQRALERAGLGTQLDRTALATLRFHVCVADLEDELIRALGPAAVQELFDWHGELDSFRTFQKQPAQQGRAIQPQLRRFIGTTSGRKARYARALVEALELSRVPRPLDGVLASV
jgi:hypothetical protein